MVPYRMDGVPLRFEPEDSMTLFFKAPDVATGVNSGAHLDNYLQLIYGVDFH